MFLSLSLESVCADETQGARLPFSKTDQTNSGLLCQYGDFTNETQRLPNPDTSQQRAEQERPTFFRSEKQFLFAHLPQQQCNEMIILLALARVVAAAAAAAAGAATPLLLARSHTTQRRCRRVARAVCARAPRRSSATTQQAAPIFGFP